jgi:hypothetical protein
MKMNKYTRIYLKSYFLGFKCVNVMVKEDYP